MHGVGEKFSLDGTGNFKTPFSLPPGRNGFHPQPNLVYSTSNSNGPFGLGWNHIIPDVSCKNSQYIPNLDKVKAAMSFKTDTARVIGIDYVYTTQFKRDMTGLIEEIRWRNFFNVSIVFLLMRQQLRCLRK